jgi:hypothetical protein
VYLQSVSTPATFESPGTPDLAPKTAADPADLPSFLTSLRNPTTPRRPALQLRRRHHQLLDLLLFHRILTDTQLAIGANFPLNPNSHYSCQRVLTKLYRHQYLDRLPRAPNEPVLYLYTRRSQPGLRLLTERWGEEVVKRHLSEPGSLGHLLGINDVAVRIRRACYELGFTLRFWQRSQDVEPILRADQLVPDAYAQVVRETESGPKTAAFFLELQHANRNVKVLRSKLERYGRLYYGGRYEQLFGTRSLRLLFVFSGASGSPPSHRVRAGVAEASSTGVSFARFAALDVLRALAPAEVLTAPVWHTPTKPEPVALFGL